MEVHTRREVERVVSGMISAWKIQVVKSLGCWRHDRAGMWSAGIRVASLALAVPGAFLTASCLGVWDEQVHTGIFSGMYSGSFLSVMWARV